MTTRGQVAVLWNPGHPMPLVEIVKSARTDGRYVARIRDAARVRADRDRFLLARLKERSNAQD